MDGQGTVYANVDTTKGSELAAYLATLTYSSMQVAPDVYADACILMTSTSSSPLLIAGRIEENSQYVYCLISGEIMYATGAFSISGTNYSADSAGFSSSVISSEKTYWNLGSDTTIASIVDTTPETWNGVILGEVSE